MSSNQSTSRNPQTGSNTNILKAIDRRQLIGGMGAFGAAYALYTGQLSAAAAVYQPTIGTARALSQVTETGYQSWTRSAYEEETGETLPEYTEAQSLADRVASGELPPVAERLPDDPAVIQPIHEIGTYCGPIRGWGINPTSFGNDVFSSRINFLIGVHPDLRTFFPQVAESYELSEDSTRITVRLRPGMKWSDGEPVTTADVQFWYEDHLRNEEVTAAISNDWRPGGEVIELEIEDEYTFSLVASVPYPIFVEFLASRELVLPRHYLEQFHRTYNPDVEAIADEEGYETWVLMYQARAAVADTQETAGRPSYDPWIFRESDSLGNKYYDRNPYYWKVDTAGQQLPYAETQVRVLTGNLETTILQIRNGEIDFGAEGLQLKDIAVLREGQEAGGYRAALWEGVTGAERRYQLNLTVNDPVLREIFNDLRFRQALSLAINRDEINDVLFFGQATPRQFTVPPSVSLYEDWMGEHFAERDVDRANELLDEMGLERRESDGLRLRSDGEPVRFSIDDAQFNEAMDELIVEYWGELGLTVEINSITRELYAERTQANEVQASVWFGDIVDEINLRTRPVSFRPPWGIDNVPHSGSLWHQWYLSDGELGEEPPEEFQELYRLAEQFQQAQRDTPEYEEYGKALLTQNVEGLYVLGTVGLAPSIVISKNNLRNFPESSLMMVKMQHIHGDQWYLEE